jgi:hypothetical protein
LAYKLLQATKAVRRFDNQTRRPAIGLPYRRQYRQKIGGAEMVKLSKEGQQLLALLVAELKEAIPGNPATYITYKQVHERLGLELASVTYGESLKVQGLSSLADWTAHFRYPGITGLIIDGTSLMPGEGYFRLFRKTKDDFQWWAEQVQLSKDFDWMPHLPDFVPPSAPKASDIMEPPERQRVTVDRIIRDTIASRRVKALHQYKCQICSTVIILPDGSNYAEAHHIRPLGRPHSGPDIADNILCVCPNHHAELDFGVRSLAIGDLAWVAGHQPSDLHISYHNKVIFKQRARHR